MTVGERILKYRKLNNLSQEEMAEKLNVSRQTISKWETDQSTPDFDKIGLLCKLFNISADELILGKASGVINDSGSDHKNHMKGLVISFSVFLYFVAVSWIIFATEFLNLNDGLVVSIFMIVCALATCLLIFYFVNHEKQNSSEKIVKKKDPAKEAIHTIVSLVATCFYLFISFTTNAWHITWLVWLIYAAFISLIDLLWDLRGDKGGK